MLAPSYSINQSLCGTRPIARLRKVGFCTQSAGILRITKMGAAPPPPQSHTPDTTHLKEEVDEAEKHVNVQRGHVRHLWT
jgi:hypothetical protein